MMRQRESRITNHEPRINRIKTVTWEWVESILVALVLALVIRHFVIQAFKIPTGSMRMTLIEGDRILVNKFIYGAKIPFTDLRLPALRQPKGGMWWSLSILKTPKGLYQAPCRPPGRDSGD